MDLKQLPDGIKRMGSIEAVFDQRLRVVAAIEKRHDGSVAADDEGAAVGHLSVSKLAGRLEA